MTLNSPLPSGFVEPLHHYQCLDADGVLCVSLPFIISSRRQTGNDETICPLCSNCGCSASRSNGSFMLGFRRANESLRGPVRAMHCSVRPQHGPQFHRVCLRLCCCKLPRNQRHFRCRLYRITVLTMRFKNILHYARRRRNFRRCG